MDSQRDSRQNSPQRNPVDSRRHSQARSLRGNQPGNRVANLRDSPLLHRRFNPQDSLLLIQRINLRSNPADNRRLSQAHNLQDNRASNQAISLPGSPQLSHRDNPLISPLLLHRINRRVSLVGSHRRGRVHNQLIGQASSLQFSQHRIQVISLPRCLHHSPLVYLQFSRRSSHQIDRLVNHSANQPRCRLCNRALSLLVNRQSNPLCDLLQSLRVSLRADLRASPRRSLRCSHHVDQRYNPVPSQVPSRACNRVLNHQWSLLRNQLYSHRVNLVLYPAHSLVRCPQPNPLFRRLRSQALSRRCNPAGNLLPSLQGSLARNPRLSRVHNRSADLPHSLLLSRPGSLLLSLAANQYASLLFILHRHRHDPQECPPRGPAHRL